MRFIIFALGIVLTGTMLLAQNSSALVVKGKQQIKARQYTAAVATLKEAIRLDPNNVQAYDALGKAYSKLNRFDEAAKVYEKVAGLLVSGAGNRKTAAAAKNSTRPKTLAQHKAPPPAHAARTANAPARAADRPGAVPLGSYECWSFSEPRMLLNFTIRSGSQYVGSDGKAGSYSYDPGSGRINFRGGFLDGVMPAGFYAIYHQPQGMPTVSFRGPSGSEASFCQKAR